MANGFNLSDGGTDYLTCDTSGNLTITGDLTVASVVLGDGESIQVDTVDEATAAAGVTIDGLLLKDGHVLGNKGAIVATITAAGGSGGATAGTFSIASTQGDESTAISAAVQMLVVVSDAQYAGHASQNANVTFNTASTGTLVASGNGWALIETDTSGAFACATANSSDETVYFSATNPAGYSDPTDHILQVVSDCPSATWSA